MRCRLIRSVVFVITIIVQYFLRTAFLLLNFSTILFKIIDKLTFLLNGCYFTLSCMREKDDN